MFAKGDNRASVHILNIELNVQPVPSVRSVWKFSDEASKHGLAG